MPESAPAASVPGAPAQAQVPASGQPDSISIPRSEYDDLTRSKASFAGAKPFMDSAYKIGIRDPKQFDEWGNLNSVLSKRGMTPAQVAKLFSDEGAAPQGGEGGEKPLSRSELDQAIAKLTKDHDGRFAKVSAIGDHKLAAKAQDALRTSILTSVLGEKPTEAEKAMFDLATDGWFNKNQRLYPDGHPLSGEEYMPHDEKSLEPLGKMLKDWRTNLAAANAIRTGDAANAGRGRTPSAAGASTPPSKPGDKPAAETRRDRITKVIDDRRAGRGQQPVSSLTR